MKRSRIIWIAAAAVLVAVAVAWIVGRAPQPEDRVYRVGWSNNPPFQEAGEDGRPTGFSIEMLREAGRRRGIKLQFVEMPGDPEAAFRANAVDLWPMVVITPERQSRMYITDPYFETALCYMTLANSRFKKPDDLVHATISLADLPVNRSLVHRDFPNATLLPQNDRKQVLDEVCQHHADAAFMDQHAAITALLRGWGCSPEPMRLISTNAQRPKEGIGATFAARAAADALREEIGVLTAQGTMPATSSGGAYFAGRATQIVEMGMYTKRRERWLITGMASVSCLFLLALWLAARLRRERNKATRAEQALRESEESARTIVETTPDAIYIGDTRARLLAVNDAACQQLGYSREQLLKMSVTDFVPARFRERVGERMRNLSNDIPTYESCHIRSDGTEVPVELKLRRLMFGGQLAFIGVARDITSRKQAELERVRLEEQLRQAQKLETVGRLAGGIAHDFNNLLTVINGYSDLILTRLPADHPARGQLREIRKAGARAAELTQQLLAFSRKQVTSPRPIDLNEVIADSEKMLQRLAGENIQLVTTPCKSLGRVMADPGQMDQVLMNLVANARDAMPDGGKLLMQTSNLVLSVPRPAGHDEMPPGSYVELNVTDTGIGMDEETRQHVFEPFFTTKSTGKGTGLGLATVYGIVRQSGGYVEVESEPRAGTSFHIYLPHTDCHYTAEEATPPRRPESRGSATILLVEDQAEVRSLFAEILSSLGYRVLEAPGGAQALALAAQLKEPLHLLLTDVVMPGMNGRELAERLLSVRPELKVLFASGYLRDLEWQHGAGVFYLPKPFQPDELAAKILEALNS